MPTNITPAGVFTDPVTRPTGGDVRNSASVQQPLQALTDRTDFLVLQLGGPDGDGEWTYKDGPRTRIIAVSLFDLLDDGVVRGDAPFWSRPAVWNGSDYFVRSLGGDRPKAVVPISKYLRDGMTLESVRMLCEPGDVPSSHPTMSVGLYYAAPTLDPSGVAVPAPVGVGSLQASSGDALQVVVLDTGSHAVVRYKSVSNRSRDYYLLITGTDSTGGGAGDLDTIYGLGLEVTDPGPGGG
jgi:hypothetical protein